MSANRVPRGDLRPAREPARRGRGVPRGDRRRSTSGLVRRDDRAQRDRRQRPCADPRDARAACGRDAGRSRSRRPSCARSTAPRSSATRSCWSRSRARAPRPSTRCEYIEGAPVVAISAQGDSPLAQAADVWLPLGPLPDTPVATLSYTATLQALGMLCDVLLADRFGVGPGPGARGRGARAHRSGRRADRCEVCRSPRARRGRRRSRARVGGRDRAARARGAEAGGHRHGDARVPARAARGGRRPDSAAIVFGRDRERCAGRGDGVVRCSRRAGDRHGRRRRRRRRRRSTCPEVPWLAAPVLQILPVQLLVEHTARLRGLTIGELRRQQHDTKVA